MSSQAPPVLSIVDWQIAASAGARGTTNKGRGGRAHVHRTTYLGLVSVSHTTGDGGTSIERATAPAAPGGLALAAGVTV